MAAAPQKAKNDAGNAEADAGNKKKKKLILIVGLAVALIAISVGGTVIALKMLTPDSTGKKAEAPEETSLAPAIYFDMAPNFTINFNVNGRQRYLQAAITLLHRDPALNELLKLHMPAIRNGLVMLLSGKNFEELQTHEGKEKLKTEALEIINNQLKKEQEALIDPSEDDGDKKPVSAVEQVLFTNFVMQ